MKRCIVPDCERYTKRRWRDPQPTMWICTRHWRLVPAPVKAEHKIAKRETRALWRAYNRTGRVNYRQWCAARCRELCAWLACIREARICDAMGHRS